jgi:hypothetical protein
VLMGIPVDVGMADSRPPTADSAETEVATEERYRVTAELEGGLVQATDTRLGREVVIELVADDAARMAWLKAVARWGGARLQRVLRLERIGDGTVRVVYEALAGRTPRPPRLSRADHALLARALAPLHAAGVAHGSVTTSLVIEDHGPALLTAGRRPSGVSVEDEMRELAGLVEDAG